MFTRTRYTVDPSTRQTDRPRRETRISLLKILVLYPSDFVLPQPSTMVANEYTRIYARARTHTQTHTHTHTQDTYGAQNTQYTRILSAGSFPRPRLHPLATISTPDTSPPTCTSSLGTDDRGMSGVVASFFRRILSGPHQ